MIVGGGSDLSAGTAMTLACYRVRSPYLLRTITGMECYVIRGGRPGHKAPEVGHVDLGGHDPARRAQLPG